MHRAAAGTHLLCFAEGLVCVVVTAHEAAPAAKRCKATAAGSDDSAANVACEQHESVLEADNAALQQHTSPTAADTTAKDVEGGLQHSVKVINNPVAQRKQLNAEPPTLGVNFRQKSATLLCMWMHTACSYAAVVSRCPAHLAVS